MSNLEQKPPLRKTDVSGSLPTQEEFVKEYERREGCELPKGYSKKDYLAGFHQCWKWIHHEMSKRQ